MDKFLMNGQASAEGGGEAPENLLHVVHRRLRGRYPWAIALGLVLSLPFAALGWKAKQPEFRSTGLVNVEDQAESVLFADVHTPIRRFDTFVNKQATFLRGRRVIDKAVENEELLDVGWPQGQEGIRLLQKKLSIGYARGESLISVNVSHPDPTMARIAVNAVLDAYNELFGETGALRATEKERTLQERERKLLNEISALQRQKIALSEEFGQDQLSTMHARKVEELSEIDREMSRVDVAISEAELRDEDEQSRESQIASVVETLSERDPVLNTLQRDLETLRAQYAGLTNLGERHRTKRRLRTEIEVKQAQLQNRFDELIEQAGEMGQSELGTLQLQTPQRLQAYRERLIERQEAVRNDASELNKKRLELDLISEQIAEKTKIRLLTTQRLDQLRVERESRTEGHVTIAQHGDIPVDIEDKRKMFAAIGAMFGGGLGVGIVFLLGLFDSRLRYIDDLEREALAVPLLGTLPDLGSKNLEHDEIAALAVHNLRNMLQLQASPGDGNCRVYTITSGSPGDGKTSLALAMGMSFALSGQKTLLLDADLVGHGLTHELGHDGAQGLCQAVREEDAKTHIQSTTIENLWTLPCGRQNVIDAKNLSQEMMQHVIGQLRQEYDTIIVDTGPLLGSLEANLMASLSDGVVLTISRGQNHKFVNACLERLRQMNAKCAGLVFNKAEARDFNRSVSAASVCSQSIRNQSLLDKSANAPERNARGALVRAVIGGPSDANEEKPAA